MGVGWGKNCGKSVSVQVGQNATDTAETGWRWSQVSVISDSNEKYFFLCDS